MDISPSQRPIAYARLEADGDGVARFWEVAVAGARLITRDGEVGSDGQASLPVFAASPEQAQRQARELIAQRCDSGYVPVYVGPDAAPPDPELFATVVDAGDDDGPYFVYADWLQSRGEPRGELITLHHSKARKPYDARVDRAERAFRKEHRPWMLPARVAEAVRGKEAIVANTDVGADDKTAAGQAGPGQCALDWRLGFVQRAHFGRPSERSPYTVRELVAALLAHPSGELLGELIIGRVGPGTDHDYRPIVATLCDLMPAALRTIRMSTLSPVHNQLDLGDISPLLASLPRLERLHLSATTLVLEPVPAPSLHTFELLTPDLSPDLLHGIDRACAGADGRSAWPALRTLTLDCGEKAIDIEGMPALLGAQGTPEIRALSLRRTQSTLALWTVLSESPLLEQLEYLDLSHGDLADHHVAEMLTRASSFAHLRELNLDGCYLSRAVRPELRTLCPEVSISRQRGQAADLPILTDEDIENYTPDMPSWFASRDVADRLRWDTLASWGAILWGRYRGTIGIYKVFVDVQMVKDTEPNPTGCTCPSAKYPCKHAIGLMLLATEGEALRVERPPPGFVDECRASRYEDDD
ncbi:MAG: TIGR02996 domain-containing protein [Myxococcota bacterium]